MSFGEGPFPRAPGEYGAISGIIPSAMCGKELSSRYPDLLLSQGSSPAEGYWMSSSEQPLAGWDPAPRRTRSAHRRPRGALRPTGEGRRVRARRKERPARPRRRAGASAKVQEIVEEAEGLLEQRVASDTRK